LRRRATACTDWRCRRITGPLGRRLSLQLTIDESTAMSSAQTEPAEQSALWITGATIYVF
jgi:hypothetical protein